MLIKIKKAVFKTGLFCNKLHIGAEHFLIATKQRNRQNLWYSMALTENWSPFSK